MRIVYVDSLDSFAWNLVHGLANRGDEVRLVQSTEITADALLDLAPDRVVLGPGPGHPSDAGVLVQLVRPLARAGVPTLGVCLGLQAIALAFGAAVTRTEPVHGEACPVFHDGRGLFAGLPQGTPMTRYHSLCVPERSVEPPLYVTATAPDGTVMGLRHRNAPLFAVQFHPESVLSGPLGQRLLDRFISWQTAPSEAPLAAPLVRA